MRERLILSRRAFVEIELFAAAATSGQQAYLSSIAWPISPINAVCFASTMKLAKAITSILMRSRNPMSSATSRLYKRIFGLR